MGLWMLAHNVTHFEDMRLCSPRCTCVACEGQQQGEGAGWHGRMTGGCMPGTARPQKLIAVPPCHCPRTHMHPTIPFKCTLQQRGGCHPQQRVRRAV